MGAACAAGARGVCLFACLFVCLLVCLFARFLVCFLAQEGRKGREEGVEEGMGAAGMSGGTPKGPWRAGPAYEGERLQVGRGSS